MNKIWNNIKKSISNQNTIKFLILLLFLVLCIVLFIVIQQQDNTMTNLVAKSKESFIVSTNGITIKIDGEDITNYDENNKLKLKDGNYEFNFTLGQINDKTINSIDFVNISGNYQNVEINKDDWEIIESDDGKIIQFTQFLNLDTEYKMIVKYNDSKGFKSIDYIIYTSMELNYTIPAGGKIVDDILNLEIKMKNNEGIEQVDSNNVTTVHMKQFNYVSFNIYKPNLNTFRVKLLETEFVDDNARKEYINKLQQFDKLVPLKFDAKLSLIKNIGVDDNNPQYVPFSELDLRNHRKENPINERIILPNPNCSSNNCELQVRNVAKDQMYILKVRLEYYYLDNIKNIRATPYYEFKFKVPDNGNDFSISKLNIIGKLEEANKLKKLFDDTQIEQDLTLNNVENEFNKMLSQ